APFQLLMLLVVAVATQAKAYAPSGWRPQVPFTLPGEYLPPLGSGVEITQARVEHVGTYSEPRGVLDVNRDRQGRAELTPQQTTTPAAQYGPPEEDGFRIVYPEEQEPSTTTESQPSISTGRYYIISDDNKLQRVVYRTAQKAAGEDFTAQLRYSAVGELQDPVYKYNAQGQLQRVLK
ncbi:hypothetical protein KR222_001414, partial [Zaprionus bogoriensis]